MTNLTPLFSQSTEQSYMAMEKQLAELLGWTEIVQVKAALLGHPPEGHPSCRGQAMVPRWCRDWAAAGPLIAQYDIDLQHDGNDMVFTNWEGAAQGHAHDVVDHPNKDASMRFAIVQAAISKLEAESKLQAGGGRLSCPRIG